MFVILHITENFGLIYNFFSHHIAVLTKHFFEKNLTPFCPDNTTETRTRFRVTLILSASDKEKTSIPSASSKSLLVEINGILNVILPETSYII